MAEVGQRLRSGACRLSALRHSQGRPVCTGENTGSPLVNGSFTYSRIKDDSTQDQHEGQSVTRKRATQRKSGKLSSVRTSESEQENETGTHLELDSFHHIRFVQTHENLQALKAVLFLSARLQPHCKEKLLLGRMTAWTRGAVSLCPDTFRSPEQLRAFCSVILILAEQVSEGPGCKQRLRHKKLHYDNLHTSTTSRNYSWRSDGGSKDTPLLYRSKTAYYDTLKVTPAATQSQIKTAYYKQSFIYHPDKNPGSKEATQRFSEISEAYTVLGNKILRRKYDRGILSQSDLQNAGRPSSKESTSRSTGSPQQQQQYRARKFSQTGGKIMFDFDAFYRAHYGEQLQREKYMRARKEQQEKLRKKQESVIGVNVVVALAMAGLMLFSVSRL